MKRIFAYENRKMHNAGGPSNHVDAQCDVAPVHFSTKHSLGIDQASFQDLLLQIVEDCFRRLRHWRAPLNCSSPDWKRELLQVAWLSALEAERDFNPTQGITF